MAGEFSELSVCSEVTLWMEVEAALELKVIFGHFVVTCFRKEIGNSLFVPPFYVKGLLRQVCIDFQLPSGYTSVCCVRYSITKEDIK